MGGAEKAGVDEGRYQEGAEHRESATLGACVGLHKSGSRMNGRTKTEQRGDQ